MGITSSQWVPCPSKKPNKGFGIDPNTLSYPIRAGAKWHELEQKQLIKLHKSKKYTLAQIANALGRSQSAVSSRLDHISAQKNKAQKVNLKKLDLSPISRRRNKSQNTTPNTLSIKYPKTNYIQSKNHNRNRKKKRINGAGDNMQSKNCKPKIRRLSDLGKLPKQKTNQRHILDAIWTQNGTVKMSNFNRRKKPKAKRKSNKSSN